MFHIISMLLVYWGIASIYLLKVNNRNTRTMCDICSKLTIIPERRLWCHSVVFNLTLNRFENWKLKCQIHDHDAYCKAAFACFLLINPKLKNTWSMIIYEWVLIPQQANTWSKSTIETLKNDTKYIQNQQKRHQNHVNDALLVCCQIEHISHLFYCLWIGKFLLSHLFMVGVFMKNCTHKYSNRTG